MTNLIHRWQDRVAPMRDSRSVEWRVVGGWRGEMAKRMGTNAWYDAASDEICIPEYLESMASDVMYAPTITHELTHAAQRQRMGLALYIVAKAFRRGALEAEAVAEEKRAQIILKVHVL